MPTIICYIPPSVQFFDPRPPSFQTRIHNPQILNRIDAPESRHSDSSAF